MNSKTLVVNGLIAALYVAVSLAINPLAFGAVQFRLPEIFNLLIVYNNKYFYGIVLGVFITNLYSPLGLYDLFFGVGQSIIALSVVMLCTRVIKSKLKLMLVNTLVFTATMCLIAYELMLVLELPFWETWLFCAIGEFIVMGIGIPIIYTLNKQLKFGNLI